MKNNPVTGSISPGKRSRLAEGYAQADAERSVTVSLPSRGQLLLPLMRCLEANGGSASPAEVYDQVAAEYGATTEVRSAEAIFVGSGPRNLFERQVRHAQQFGKIKGLIEARRRGHWSLTDKAFGVLENARPGVVLAVFETSRGLALWGHVEEAASLIEPGSVDTIFTSPPYPVLSQKEYGGPKDAATWLSWMFDLVDLWRPLLAPGGSMFINLGAEVYRRGQPFQSLYLERFAVGMEDRCGMQLAQRWWWHNPAKLGSIHWVSIRRRRLKQTIEPIYWWVNVKDGIQDAANNQMVLQPYKDKKRPYKTGIRPSGIDIGVGAFDKDNGGAIPSTLIIKANSSSNDPYRRACRAAGIKIHPATFPESLPERAILMTTQPGDLVLDPFFGSGSTGVVAERLGRRWIGIDRARGYLRGAALRFTDAVMTDFPPDAMSR
ncbi:MAG: DNA methylase [Desulfovibrio sp.]|nr:DNA methylase [Desulfovibrio sp.]